MTLSFQIPISTYGTLDIHATVLPDSKFTIQKATYADGLGAVGVLGLLLETSMPYLTAAIYNNVQSSPEYEAWAATRTTFVTDGMQKQNIINFLKDTKNEK